MCDCYPLSKVGDFAVWSKDRKRRHRLSHPWKVISLCIWTVQEAPVVEAKLPRSKSFLGRVLRFEASGIGIERQHR